MNRVLKNGDYKITYRFDQHKGFGKGVDVINKKTHSDTIVAHSDGVVVKVVDYMGGTNGFPDREGKTYGNYVAILHADNVVTTYCHLAKTYVKEGQTIIKGADLGFMGNTGASNGVHLHFEVRKYKTTPTAKNLNDTDLFEFVEPSQYLDKDLPIEYLTHKVVKGDTLWKLAVKYLKNGLRYTEIKKLNGLKSNTIYQGTTLLIPIAKSSVTNTATTTTTTAKNYPNYNLLSSDWYRVRKSWSDTKSQKGAFKMYSLAVNRAKQYAGYHVYDKDGTLIY